MKSYKNRIADKSIDVLLHTFGAVSIEGPKLCGKTTTALQLAKSVVSFEDPLTRRGLLYTAANNTTDLLKGDNPRLFDEWQDAPEIWDAVRCSVDKRGGKGLYILTGSSSKFVDVAHTGTGRIASFTMWPMSLYESEESNGQVSLRQLFDNPDSFESCRSDLSIEDLTFAICRGGWPESIFDTDKKFQLEYVENVLEEICKRDIGKIDNTRKNPDWTESILKTYARNICQLATDNTILKDASGATGMNRNTVTEYIESLKKIYVVEDIYAWNPAIRSKTALRSSPKHNIVDPSIAAAAMGMGPEYFKTDFKTLGFLFESMCLRDLKIYGSAIKGKVSYYRDRYGLEADCVMYLRDGRYALIECKMGQSETRKAVEHLCELETLIKNHDQKKENEQCPIGPPTLKIVLTGTEYGFRTKEGVFIIPLGCLKD